MSLEHSGLSHIPGGSSSTAATAAARNRPGPRPACEGRAEAGGLPLGALVSSRSPPRSLTSSVGRLAEGPGSVRGFLPEQALGHLVEVGAGGGGLLSGLTRGSRNQEAQIEL